MASVPRIGDIPQQLSPKEFWDLFGHLEHAGLDFKRGVPADIRDTIAAMAMTHGGLIVHGVDDRRLLVGCPLSQNTQDRITRIAAECGVDVQLLALAVDDLELTLCAVPEVRGRIVTTPDGRLLRRVGGDSQPLRGDAMARFVREREHRAGEDEPLAVVDLSAFDIAAVNQALTADGRPAVKRDGIERALTDLGVAVASSPPLESRVLRAALVLFASEPQPQVRGAAVQLVRRTGVGPGPGPSSAREECSGPLAETVDCCLGFLAAHTRQFETVTGSRREALPEYPEPVLREAIVNALAHRDYGLTGATVDITVWDDRIEVRSPGSLPGHITLGNMRAEHYSRNPRIMRVLKTLGLVEEYGDGIDRMYREMEARLLEPPAFEATASSVTVTLRNRMLVDVEDQVWLNQLGRDDVTAGERRALVAARREGAVTPRELRGMLPETDVDTVLAQSVAKGLLTRVGRRGGSRYVLSDAMVRLVGSPGMAKQNRKRQSLLDEIRRRGSLSTTEAATVLDEAPAFARGMLNELVRVGLARAAGKTRARRYYLR
ncbi:MAG: hypothetical protein F4X11_11030 [Acidobacteria bacterium]|nr:hypothetical protein [Acidobacteriota bacterium]